MAVADEPERSRRSAASRCLSAYTILFALIVITAFRRGSSRPGPYELDADGQPIPGTYHEVESTPQRIVVDSLMAPINGLYGIESAEDGNVSVWNSRRAVRRHRRRAVHPRDRRVPRRHDEDRRDPGAASRASSPRLKGRERWMIPILMAVFALGGTTFGMAEESLAFYALIITVMIAAGYDALVGALRSCCSAAASACSARRQPVRHRHRVGLRRDVASARGSIGRLVILVVGHGDRHLRSCCATPIASRRDPSRSLVFDDEGRERGPLPARPSEGGGVALTALAAGSCWLLFFLAFAVMIYGVIPWEDLGIGVPTLWWWFPEMTASFLLFAIIIGLVGRMNETELHRRPSSTARATCSASP